MRRQRKKHSERRLRRSAVTVRGFELAGCGEAQGAM
jgi:hypothetical protein